MRLELSQRGVVKRPDGGFLGRPIHPLSLAVGPGVERLLFSVIIASFYQLLGQAGHPIPRQPGH